MIRQQLSKTENDIKNLKADRWKLEQGMAID